ETTREPADGGAVRSLVEEEPGLLPAPHVDEMAHALLVDLDALGRLLARGETDPIGEALLATRAAGRALEDAERLERRRQRVEDEPAQALGAGVQELQ